MQLWVYVLIRSHFSNLLNLLNILKKGSVVLPVLNEFEIVRERGLVLCDYLSDSSESLMEENVLAKCQ